MTIIFYDGDCGLCQRSISFLSHADKTKKLLFAPLNGVTYKLYFKKDLKVLSSVIVYSNEKIYEKSSAVFELCKLLPGVYQLLLVFKLIPPFILDKVYDQIAARRSRVSCVLFSRDERFLN